MRTENGQLFIDAGASPRGWSRIGTILGCLQSYAFRYGPRDLPVTPGSPLDTIRQAGRGPSTPAQATGTVLHAGLAHYRARQGAARGGIVVEGVTITDPEQLVTPQAAMILAAEQEEDAGGAPNLQGALQGFAQYVATYGGDRAHTIAVECLFSATIACEPHVVPIYEYATWNDAPTLIGERTVTEYQFTARVDWLWADPGRRIHVTDFKTTGRIEAKHARIYSIHGQLIGQRWLASQVYGAAFGGVHVDMIQTDGTKCERPNLDPSPALLARFPSIVVGAEQRVEAEIAKGLPLSQWTPLVTETGCYGRYGPCPHMNTCMWGSR